MPERFPSPCALHLPRRGGLDAVRAMKIFTADRLDPAAFPEAPA